MMTLRDAVGEIEGLIARLGDDLNGGDYLDALDEMVDRAQLAAETYADAHAEDDANYDGDEMKMHDEQG